MEGWQNMVKALTPMPKGDCIDAGNIKMAKGTEALHTMPAALNT